MRRFFFLALAAFSFLSVYGSSMHTASAEKILCHTDLYGKNQEFKREYYIETDSIYTDTVFLENDRIYVDVYLSGGQISQYFFFHYKGNNVDGGGDISYDEWKFNYYIDKGKPLRAFDEYHYVKGNKVASDILYATLEAKKYL